MLSDHRLTAVISNLSLRYGSKLILEDASCHFRSGELNFLCGSSGNGKTSLFYLFNRLSENFPSLVADGSLRLLIDQKWVDVYPTCHYPLAALRAKVAMVFQVPHLLPGSIRRNFSLPLRLVKKMSKASCETIMKTQLIEVGLWDELKDNLDKAATSLSIGQQQRLCLARALVMDPSFLFLDEPTASLDSESADKILSLLHNLRDRYTIVLISHNAHEWERYGDRVWRIRDRKLIELV